jgi:hypothetical protein
MTVTSAPGHQIVILFYAVRLRAMPHVPYCFLHEEDYN